MRLEPGKTYSVGRAEGNPLTTTGEFGLPLANTILAVSQPTPVKISSSNKGALFTAECEDGMQRFCKSNAVHCNAPACEWIAAQLALQAGYSVLDPSIVRWKDELLFGCPLVAPGSMIRDITGPSDPRFAQTDNCDTICYQAVCFDAWILNPDRHNDNILFVSDPSAPNRFHAVLSDHDKGLMGHADELGEERLIMFTRDPLANWVENVSAWVREDCEWRNAITEWAKIEAQANKIIAIPADMIRAIVAQVPDEWIRAEWRNALEAFLLTRQERLLDIIRHHAARLPNVVGPI